MHGALCGGPDALPLVHDDSPRDEAIAAFSLYVLQRLGVTVRSRANMSGFFASFICGYERLHKENSKASCNSIKMD